MELNIFGDSLIACCSDPVTGYFRDGFCRTISEDFLAYSASRGNNLMRPMPHWNFPGLQPGDKWCLCISRWLEAEKAGKAPPIILEATHQKTLQYASLELLQQYAFVQK
jgi:uncharacterized protein (DUF2237 family)